MFGSGPVLGINPADEYTFIVYVAPFGSYYKKGLKPIDVVIFDDYDRAAPRGAGAYKVAGNYAGSMYSLIKAKRMGYNVVLFLDSKEHKYFEEFTTPILLHLIGITPVGIGWLIAADGVAFAFGGCINAKYAGKKFFVTFGRSFNSLLADHLANECNPT